MWIRTAIPALAAAVLLAACSSDGPDDANDESNEGGRPQIVVTTSILGDVVGELVADRADVDVLMPPGVDPHGFQPSAQDIARVSEADALIVNGGGFEEGLEDPLRAAEDDGVPLFAAIDAVETLDLDDGTTVDPHFFTDPVRMAEAAEGIVDFLAAELPELERDGTAYADELRTLDAEVEQVLSSVPEDDRVLVTNHEVLDYFADRYGFEVIGTVVPGGSTTDAVSAGELDALADVLRSAGVTAVFAETSAPAELAETLADEVGDGVEVVELYTESLGEEGSDGATYVDMVRTNAARIAAALGNDT